MSPSNGIRERWATARGGEASGPEATGVAPVRCPRDREVCIWLMKPIGTKTDCTPGVPVP